MGDPAGQRVVEGTCDPRRRGAPCLPRPQTVHVAAPVIFVGLPGPHADMRPMTAECRQIGKRHTDDDACRQILEMVLEKLGHGCRPMDLVAVLRGGYQEHGARLARIRGPHRYGQPLQKRKLHLDRGCMQRRGHGPLQRGAN